MRHILAELTQKVGVRGAAVVTRDGMVVASALSRDMDEDALAAIGASLVLNTIKALANIEMDDVERVVVLGTRGKIILVDAHFAFLVVVTDHTIKLDVTMLDIAGAAYKLRKASRLEV